MGSQTGFGILDFYRTITSRGLARNNTYRIKSIANSDIDIFKENQDLLIYAQGGNVPSRQISSARVNFKTFEFPVPMVASYPENSSYMITFYCDASYALRDILENWSRCSFDEHKNISTINPVDLELVLLEASFSPTEKSRNTQPKEIRKYSFRSCFPSQIGSSTYVNGSNGEFVVIPVNMSFQYVISDNIL